MSRVVFYSREDGASYRNLVDTATLLNCVNVNSTFSVNDLLEFKNVQLYFDNEMFLKEWDQSTIFGFNETLAKLDPLIKQYFLLMDDQRFEDELHSVEFNYRKAYWALFNNLHAYKKISTPIFQKTLSKNLHHIHYILSRKKIVDHFNTQIKAFLMSYEVAAEIILSSLEKAEGFRKTDTHLPKSLTIADKEAIIARYIAKPDANLNFIILITNSKDSTNLKLSRKVRLQAQKRAKEINDATLSQSSASGISIEVHMPKEQIEPVVINQEKLGISVSYSVPFLDGLHYDSHLFACFARLFEYTDNQNLITLVAKETEQVVFERFSMKSKNAYPTGFTFTYKNHLGQLQIVAFDHYLKTRNSSVEKLIGSFIQTRLQCHQGLTELRLKLPEESASHLVKIRALAPELEFLLKQYQCFASEGTIDFELLELDSSALNLSEVESCSRPKYVYPKSDEVKRLKHLFFSDQSMLYYVKPFENKYHNLYDLLVRENKKS